MALGVRAKFFLVTLLIVGAVDLAAGSYLQWKLRADHEARIEAEISRHALTAQALLEIDSTPWKPDSIDPIADRLGRAIGSRVTIIDIDGVVLGDSELDLAAVHRVENHGARPEFQLAGSRSCVPTRRHSTTVDTDMLYCAVKVESGPHRGFVRVAMPLQAVDAELARLRMLLLAAGLLGLALATGVGWVLSRGFAQTIRGLMEAARAMAEGDADRRMPVPGTDELGGLAGSINRVAEELERTVKALAAERDRFEAVLQSMDEAVIAVDADQRIIAVNRAATELLGSQAGEARAMSRPLRELVDMPELEQAVAAAIQGEARSIDIKLSPRGPGQDPAALRQLMVRVTPQGESGGAVVVIHDVTEVRRLETVRRDFVANVSHELRTPVSVIQANTETLLAGAMDEPEQAKRFLEAVRRNAERLGRLIADLLDISRIEAGKYQIDMRPLSLAAVVRSVQKAVAESCRRRSVKLVVEVDEDIRVFADASALEQVLINLVENAVKYGPEGGTVELVGEQSEAGVRIEVRDEGPGIEPMHRRRVFERFYRVDPGRSRGMGGTGLGLAIVKNLSEAMGGEVGVLPREPTGSAFFLRLGPPPGEPGPATHDS